MGMHSYITDNQAAAIAAVLLVIYLGIMVHGMTAPVRQSGGERSQAMGCLMFVVVILGILGLLLAIGWYFHVRILVWGVLTVTAYPVAQSMVSIIFSLYGRIFGARRNT